MLKPCWMKLKFLKQISLSWRVSIVKKLGFFFCTILARLKLKIQLTTKWLLFLYWQERALGFRYEGAGIKMESELPHLVCIDDDVLSTGVTLYHLKVDGVIFTHINASCNSNNTQMVLLWPSFQRCKMNEVNRDIQRTWHGTSYDCAQVCWVLRSVHILKSSVTRAVGGNF